MFYTAPMEGASLLSSLEEELRAQTALVAACFDRAAAAGDPRLKSAWRKLAVRLMNVSAATGWALAALKWAPRHSGMADLAVGLRLPKLPPLPDSGGSPPPHKICKTTSGGFANRNSHLTATRANPRLAVKPKGGAPKGNRNAQKSGCHTAQF